MHVYTRPLRDRANLISRECRKSKQGEHETCHVRNRDQKRAATTACATAVCVVYLVWGPTMCVWLLHWYEARRCVFGCCIGRETLTLLVVVSRSPAVHQPPTNTPWLLAQKVKKSFKNGSSCSCAAAVLLLWTDFVTAHTPRTHTWYMLNEAHKYTHTLASTVCCCQKRESSHGGCCLIVTATSTEPRGL